MTITDPRPAIPEVRRGSPARGRVAAGGQRGATGAGSRIGGWARAAGRSLRARAATSRRSTASGRLTAPAALDHDQRRRSAAVTVDRAPRRRRTAAAPAAPTPKRAAAGSVFWFPVLLVAVLSLIGLVMVLSASSTLSLSQYGSPWHYFERQLVWLVVGSLGFALALRVGIERWRRLAPAAMLCAVLMLLVVLVPGIGVRTAGAARWIGTSSVQIQPSEFAKLALVLFAADVLDRRAGKRDWKYQMMPVILLMVLLSLLVIAQPDLGTTAVLVCIAVGMLFMAGLPLRPLGVVVAGGAAFSLLMAVAAPYRWRRLTSFLHPFRDASNSGYQSVQALLALSHGHVLGDGLGQSIASSGYLPNAETDFIFAVIGEETGLIGSLTIVGMFAAFAVAGIRVACHASTRYAALVAAGIVAWLVGQAVINIGAVVGVLPVTGVPLPFVSFGGSSLVIALFAAGLLANVARQS